MKTYTVIVTRASSPPLPINYQIQLQVRANTGGTAFNLPNGSTFNSVTPSLNNSGKVAVKVNTVGLTTSPGMMLAKVTSPARGAESYVSSVNRTSATPTIDPAMRASCIESTTRARYGMRSSAR